MQNRVSIWWGLVFFLMQTITNQVKEGALNTEGAFDVCVSARKQMRESTGQAQGRGRS